MDDPLTDVFVWWLGPLRAAGYRLSDIPEAVRAPVRDAIRQRGIDLMGLSGRYDRR